MDFLVAMESYICSGTKICIHLSLLYTFCIKHCFLPFIDINIIPVIKIKVVIEMTLIINAPLRCRMQIQNIGENNFG